MKNFSIHIKSIDVGNIYINGSFAGLIDNIYVHSLDLKVYSDKIIITKEPISNDKTLALPYTIQVLFLNNKVTSDSKYVTIVPYKSQQYDIILNACEVKHHKNLEKVYDNFIDNYNVSIVNDGISYITIYQDNIMKLSFNSVEITNIFCEMKNIMLIIKGMSVNNHYYSAVINTQNFELVYNNELEKMEYDNEYINILENVNDLAKHGKVTIINTQNGEMKTHYVYLQDNALTTKSPKIIPYAFFQAVMVENYTLAQSYLSDRLINDNIQDNIKNFFDSITKVYYNSYSSTDTLVNYTIKTSRGYNSYDFTILNNKIDDIEEVDFK